jgi:hypothetical protein
MDQLNPLKRKILLAAAGLVLLMGLIAVALKLDLVASPQPAAKGASQTVTFKDGGTLEILGVSVGERLVEDRPARGVFKYFVRQKGGSSYFHGGNSKSLKVEREREDGRDVRFRIHSDSKGALLMEIRLKASNGMPMKLPFYMVDRDSVFEDRRLGSMIGPKKLNLPDGSVEQMSQAMKKASLELLIQLRDPQAGWIDLTGPFFFNAAWPDRYMMVLTAWQRNLPILDFRAILSDGQVAEFSLPSPDIRKAPAAVAPPAVLPLVHRGSDFTLTLRKVERFSTPGEHPFAALEMDLHYTGTPAPGLKEGPLSFEEAALKAEDEWGNDMGLRSDSIKKQTRWGAYLPADSKRVMIDLRVARSDSYPQPVRDGFTVLEGVVSADGLTVDFKPCADAGLFGISAVSAGKIIPNPSGYGESKDWKQLEFELRGENDIGRLPIIERRIGDIQNLKVLIFPADSNESAGFPSSQAGGSGSGMDKFHFSRNFWWTAPPELLGPGAKIRVGIHGPLKRDDIRFDLELPGLIQPR